MKSKQADRRGDRQLKEIGGANQCRRTRNAVAFAGGAIEPVGDSPARWKGYPSSEDTRQELTECDAHHDA
jgi:hypothetical protein